MFRRYFVLFAFLSFAAAPALKAQSFEQIPFPAQGAWSVSPDGSAVAGAAPSVSQAFLWTEDEGLLLLDPLPEQTNSIANDVSTDGLVVVGQSTIGSFRAFRWTAATGMVDLGQIPGGGVSASAWAVSADGSVVVGWARYLGRDVAFRWTAADGMVNLGSLTGDWDYNSVASDVSANGNVVVGRSESDDGYQVVRWVGGVIVALVPTTAATYAYPGVSADGSVIVGHLRNLQAFRWTSATGAVSLGPDQAYARAVSADGNVIVGQRRVSPTSNNYEPFIWTNTHGMRVLKDVMIQDYGLDVGGWTLTDAPSISHDGTVIVGHGYRPDGHFAAWRAILPRSISPLLEVNSTADRVNLPGISNCNTGETITIEGEEKPECTLRAAIQAAAIRGVAETITFNIPGSGPHTIAPVNALPGFVASVTLNATTQPGYTGTPLVLINGGGALANGFILNHGNSTVRGLSFGGFTGAGILITGNGENVVEANYMGLHPNGSTPIPNGVGIRIDGSPNNLIGGNTVEARNIISGNLTHGIHITGGVNNRIQGNFIGLNTAGSETVGNGTDNNTETGHHGILIEGAGGTVIGYAQGSSGNPGQGPGNVIAGSAAHGVRVAGTSAAPAPGVVIAGNLIGLNAAGTGALSNVRFGIDLSGAVTNARVADNVIVNQNLMSGIVLIDLGAAVGAPDGTRITGNTIGLNAAGSAALGESFSGVTVTSTGDILERGVANVHVGEETDGNRINASIGIWLEGVRTGGARVEANTIGLLANGMLIQGNTDRAIGVFAELADSLHVTGNIIGGHIFGMVLAGNGHTVHANYLGTNPAGTSARPNQVGLNIPGTYLIQGNGFPVGSNVTVGAAGQGNVISGNSFMGLQFGDSFNSPLPPSNRANLILTQPEHAAFVQSLRLQLPTSVADSPVRDERPWLDMRGDDDLRPTGTVIAYNLLGTNAEGTAALGNGVADDPDEAGAGLLIRGGLGTVVFGNTISGNGAGLVIQNENFSNNGPEATIVAGNRIGAARNSNDAIPNQHLGVLIYASNNNVLLSAPFEGGDDPEVNLIMGNGGPGVRIIHEDGWGLANTIRQTHFLTNGGAAIDFFDSDTPGTMPPGVPEEPEAIIAVQGETEVLFRLRPGATGDLDLFFTAECRAVPPAGSGGKGEPIPMGDGIYFFSAEGTAENVSSLLIPIADFPLNPVGLYLSATSTTIGENGTTSSFSGCVRIAHADDVAEIDFPEGFTGPVEGTEEIGINLEVTENDGEGRSGDNGQLLVARHHFSPHGNFFEGTASSDDGTIVEPDVVSSTRYWTLTSENLAGVTYNVCVDITEITEIKVPEQLVLVHREHLGRPWVPADSWLSQEGTRLCAADLIAFGDIGIGGDEEVNPVPNEPGPNDSPEIFALSPAFPNPTRDYTTLILATPASSNVHVDVFDALGRQVISLHDGPMTAGEHHLRLNTSGMAPGVYIVRVTAGNRAITQRVVVIR